MFFAVCVCVCVCVRVYVCVYMCRCDGESVQISESVVEIERELENQQQICQTLQSELQDLEMETAQCQLNKTQVFIHTKCEGFLLLMECVL